MTASIRRASLGDAAALAEVHFAAWSQAYRGVFPDEIFKHWSHEERVREWEARIERHPALFVAIRSGRPVGYGSYQVKENMATHVASLYVHPDHQRARISAQMFQAMVLDSPLSTVSVDVLEGNKTATAVYEAWGGRPSTGPDFTIAARTYPTVRYQWQDRDRLIRRLTPVHIRPWQPEDSVEHLTELLHEGYRRNADANLHFIATHQSAETTRSRMDGGQCFLAIADKDMVGTILGRAARNPYGDLILDQSSVKISQFAVHPDWSGRRIGERLLAAAENWARDFGAQQIVLDTAEPAQDLIAYYHRLGFTVIGSADWRPEVNYESVIMAKPLANLGVE